MVKSVNRFSSYSFFELFVRFLFYLLLGGIVMFIVMKIYDYYFHINILDLDHLPIEKHTNAKAYIRVQIAIQHIFMFILPGLFFANYLKKKLEINLVNSWKLRPTVVFWAFCMLVSSYPLVMYLGEINRLIPISEFFKKMEENNIKILFFLFTNQSLFELMLHIVLIAILPAIGEELIFRGGLQTIFSKRFNPHVAIFLSSFLFSAFHFQLEGLLPRIALGMMLGYLFLWSSNILFPVMLHFLNNFLTLLGQYLLKGSSIDPNILEAAKVPIYLVFISGLLIYQLTKLLKTSLVQQKSLE